MEKKSFRYFAIRIAGTIVFRRTADKLNRVHSVLYKPRTTLRLEQVSYTGGHVVGSMAYTEWLKCGKRQLTDNGYVLVTRDTFHGLKPYMQKGEL
jgi:hypothetical protein